MVYKILNKEIESCVKKTHFPPKYNKRKWKSKNFNCYMYALNACMDFRKYYNEGCHIAPGFLSRGIENDFENTEEKILQYFIEDCKVLNLNIAETLLEEKIAKNEYKIAVYVWEDIDYHFVRQDSNGNWSEKQGWSGKIKIVKESDIRKKFLREYRYIGMFKVSKKT